jgi:uncharacterized protein
MMKQIMEGDQETISNGVVATASALEAISKLRKQRGPIIFFQSGGCCDGSAPMCFDEGELILGTHDVLLGYVGGSPFYMDKRQFEVWKHTKLILDVEDGEPDGFSLPAGSGKHFVIKSELCAISQIN